MGRLPCEFDEAFFPPLENWGVSGYNPERLEMIRKRHPTFVEDLGELTASFITLVPDQGDVPFWKTASFLVDTFGCLLYRSSDGDGFRSDETTQLFEIFVLARLFSIHGLYPENSKRITLTVAENS